MISHPSLLAFLIHDITCKPSRWVLSTPPYMHASHWWSRCRRIGECSVALRAIGVRTARIAQHISWRLWWFCCRSCNARNCRWLALRHCTPWDCVSKIEWPSASADPIVWWAPVTYSRGYVETPAQNSYIKCMLRSQCQKQEAFDVWVMKHRFTWCRVFVYTRH